MFEPINIKVNYTRPEYAIADTGTPVFSWGVSGKEQSAYKLTVTFKDKLLWDTGIVKTEQTSCIYDGLPLPSGAVVNWKLQLFDRDGNESKIGRSYYKTACFDVLSGKWIKSPYEKDVDVQYFTREFAITEKPERAVLYHCGLGLSKAYINDNETDNYRLQPLHTNYAKECFYVTTPLAADNFSIGENKLQITVAGGWRTNYGHYLDNMSNIRQIEFMGEKCLWAMLVLYYADGKKEVIATDTEWKATTGNIISSHLFDGEIYDENAIVPPEKSVVLSDFSPIKISPQYLEPVCVKRELKPQNSYIVGGKTIYDFGENFAGVVKLKAKGTCKNVKFILRHSEEVSETGELFCDTLRGAKAEDVYIARNGACEICFAPQFTYHGFRYASLEIDGEFDGEAEITALNFYTDIDTDAFFKCGNQVVTEYYNTTIRTERANLHTVATDCPQRDERMAWMNDATVRFMSMPYYFSCARLFEKIADDIKNEQGEDGAITCTAPFVFGERPADPVCMAYPVAANEYYNMTGDTRVIEKHYDSFKMWCECLGKHAPDGIVDYSYYGDWAGPEDCCYAVDTIGDSDAERLEGYEPGAANSRYISGEMMSTAMYYMTLGKINEFAYILEKSDNYQEEMNRVKTAFLNKWFDKDKAIIGRGTQGEQALALYAKLIPGEYETKAAKVMADAVLADGSRLKTGNLVTPMLLDMLSCYGYTDVAWKILTREEYPSFGYMLANGATTMWERFELKEDAGMNSHNHPMYGASSGWIYRRLAGFNVIVPNREYVLSPNIPKDLLYFEVRIPLLCGSIYLKCMKKHKKLNVLADVPFSVNVTLNFEGKKYELHHGFNSVTL